MAPLIMPLHAVNTVKDHLAPAFSFLGEDGSVETTSHVRSVVTIAAFPDNADWPGCGESGETADLANRPATLTATGARRRRPETVKLNASRGRAEWEVHT